MISIQTNVNSLVAQQNLSVNSAFQSKTIAQLTSGYRINQSGDDAAGLAVANKFRSTVAELTQGVANGNDATAQLQIMDGGMSNISSILDRLKTLATQSASGTFTGNRVTLNTEFQNDLLEIDRQAKSIGLNTGGTFAKNLDVYLGQGSGSNGSLANGQVTLGLANSTVDSQSLGMKGLQALISADLGTGTSSVASVLANDNNKSTEAAAGYATFSFAGAGFSDASKVKVQVNLSGVSDAATLVNAFNSAITSAGSGSPQALAFAKANIVASVTTDSSGQHLAFTSGTSAFQVQAGDKMANALLGNFKASTSEGADIKTTLTGSATAALAASTTTAFTPDASAGVQIRIQGSGLAKPVDLTIKSSATIVNVADAVNNLKAQVSSSAELQAAGISVDVYNDGTNGDQLRFTSKTGESLNVMATGDKTNQLGFGSFVTNATSNTAVDYSTIKGTANATFAATTNNQATMQISINGASAANVSVNLTDTNLGATKANTTTTATLDTATIHALEGKVLTVSVDGIAATTAVLDGGSAAAISGNVNFASGGTTKTVAAATTSQVVGSAAVTATDWSTVDDKFTINVNGSGVQTILLTGLNYQTTANDGALQTLLNSQLTGATASVASGIVTFTATTAGAGDGTGIVIANGTGTGMTKLQGAGGNFTTTPVVGANGNGAITISTNMDKVGAARTATITLDPATYGFGQTDIVAAANAKLKTANLQDAGGTIGVIASLDINGGLTFSSSTMGPGAWVTVGDPGAATSGLTNFGIAAGTSVGTDASAASIQSALQTAIDTATAGTGTNAGATVSLDSGNHIVITNNNAGAGHSVSALSDTGVVAVAGLAGTVSVGTDLTGDQLAAALNQQFTTGDLSKAQLTASWGTNQLTITSGNNTNFRVNSGTTNTATLTGTANVSAHAWSGAAQTFRISKDGGALSADITLSNTTTTDTETLAEINRALGAASVTGVTASIDTSHHLVLKSDTVGSTASIQVAAGSGTSALGTLGLGTAKVTADADLGFGVSGASFTSEVLTSGHATANLTAAAPNNFVVDAGGASQALVNGNTALNFSALKFGNDSQAITISANDTNGGQQSKTITLKNFVDTVTPANTNTAGRSIDEAISYINKQLQDSNNATLQKIVAVKQNVGNQDKINFISSLASFNVGLGSTANADGINDGTATNVAGAVTGAGANMQIDTREGALAALTAITDAVAKLGTAQAAVGKGQNQLTYAVSLAQSQITNFSAAESQIRDANVAQQAANLSKAQTLSQASIAAMAQANSAPQGVLSLLRG